MGLAGVKKKQRIAADPQNKTWKDDKSKFGYKMLLKMGWEEGKGLGKDGDGLTDHLVVDFKNDTAGLGVATASKSDARQETYQQLVGFERVLERINQDQDTDSKPLSRKEEKKKEKERRKRKKDNSDSGSDSEEEEKKTKSKKLSVDPSSLKAAISGRLAHRRKFIRNKQVDQYTPQELKEILGV